MEILITLLVLVGIVGIGFGSWKIHQYSITHYGYSPYNLLMALASISAVVAAYFGFFVLSMGTLNVIVYYSALGCGLAFMYFRAFRGSNWWVALWGVLTMLIFSVVVALAWILIKREIDRRKS